MISLLVHAMGSEVFNFDGRECSRPNVQRYERNRGSPRANRLQKFPSKMQPRGRRSDRTRFLRENRLVTFSITLVRFGALDVRRERDLSQRFQSRENIHLADEAQSSVTFFIFI